MNAQLQRVVDALERHGCRPVKNGTGYGARCPSHDDKRASLTLSEGEVQPVVINCFAGCQPDQILASLGLSWSDVCEDREASEPKRIVATYDYHNEDGNVLYQTVRYVPKDFRQRRPDGKGGWLWNLKGVRRVLYRLPAVLATIEDGGSIYLVEGEKDADGINDLDPDRTDYVATCNPMGAGKWGGRYAETLKGAARVLVVQDKDEPGRRHAHDITASLRGKVGSIELVEAKSGKDASDHLGAGHGLEDFVPVAVEEPADKDDHDGGELDLLALAVSKQEPEPVPHLLSDDSGESPIVDGDIIVEAGEGESGKSTLAQALALSLSTGTDFAGRFTVAESMPVLYLDGENNDRLITRRWLRLLNGNPEAQAEVLKWESSRFRYRWRGRLTIDTEEDRDYIVARCEEYNSKVLILDTQIRFTAGDLTQARDAANIYAALADIKRRAGLRLVILLAHLRKRQGGKGAVNDLGQRLYGSVDIRNSCDCLLILTKSRDGGVTVVHEKTRWDRHYPNFSLELQEDGSGAVRLVAGKAVNNPINTIRQVLENAEREGALRKDLEAAVAEDFPDMNNEAIKKAVSRELDSRYYVSQPEGRSKRYWLRLYGPEDAA